jgi:hypothetical protein
MLQGASSFRNPALSQGINFLSAPSKPFAANRNPVPLPVFVPLLPGEAMHFPK